jgi:D-alanyl-lipoteichoic acid acyltransferase DltB (MBOAT superfamily)
MLFNSIQFAVFLPIVFLLYWFVFDRFISKSKHQLRLQNIFIVVSSYVFYGWWDWRFLLLIAFTSFCSWGSGLLIGKAQTKKRAKTWMWLNIILNLGILALFKYYDFFVVEFAQLFHLSTEGLLIKVILPVGISFYTFQALSYSIDIYRGKIEPTKDIVAFFAFISFFPQLVAGPIERASSLLPQFLKKREFDYDTAMEGMRQILWGLFKKLLIANNCAYAVDSVFYLHSRTTIPGSDLLLAAILFSFQIYADFSGYSDIAIGTAKLFGIKLSRNFNNPYFSRNVSEFWRRWHISLMSWFRDYVYIPLGGNQRSKLRTIINVFVVFLLSGMWHGANWTFIVWGLYHAVLFLPSVLMGRKSQSDIVAKGRILPSLKETGQMFFTFCLVLFGWILFRSESISDFVQYCEELCQMGTLRACYRLFIQSDIWPKMVFIIIMLVVEWLQRDKEHGLVLDKMKPWLRWVICFIIVLMIACFTDNEIGSFIYFQF